MKIAFVHYHLKTGGVTSVLKRQISAVQGVCDTLVLTGDRASTALPCSVIEISGLGYDQPGVSPPDAEQVADRMLRALSGTWPGGCDILHVHNPTLAKNRNFLQIIKLLQQAGVNLFLQIHDFAEDGRPDLYFRAEAYPADCHYGVINARDAVFLLGSGLDRAGLHHIPNAVQGMPANDFQARQRQVLYPVRAIRRKNHGEAILLSMFFKENRRLAITQPPNSPADAASYRDWTHWVNRNRLCVDFEVGKNTDFASLLQRSCSVVTTSIAEGFGLSFLEPWTAGKLLWGRRLNHICEDFEKSGIRLDHLYDRLDIPLVWIDAAAFSRDWHAAVQRAVRSYGLPVSEEMAGCAFARMTRGEIVDFGMLSEKYQRQVLTHLIAASSDRNQLTALNPWLSCPGALPDPEAGAIIEENRRAALQHYGMPLYRIRLLKIYDQVRSHPVCQRIDKIALCTAFFDLDRFSLLKWGTYDG
jgi:hypothetical protein